MGSKKVRKCVCVSALGIQQRNSETMFRKERGGEKKSKVNKKKGTNSECVVLEKPAHYWRACRRQVSEGEKGIHLASSQDTAKRCQRERGSEGR